MSTRRIRVATWNVHGGIDRNGRRFDVAAACSLLAWDLLALQEAWDPASGESLVPAVAEAAGAPGAFASPRRRNAASGRLSPFRVALVSRLPVRASWAWPLAPGRHGVVRACLVADVEVGAGVLRVGCMHVSAGLRWGPRQWSALRQVADPRRRHAPGAPGRGLDVLLGDANLWGPGVLAALGPTRWQRAVVGPTWPAHRPHSQVDHVLVARRAQRAGRVQVLGGEVARWWAGDHRAVHADLAVTGP